MMTCSRTTPHHEHAHLSFQETEEWFLIICAFPGVATNMIIFDSINRTCYSYGQTNAILSVSALEKQPSMIRLDMLGTDGLLSASDGKPVATPKLMSRLFPNL